jgi:hypothetical protein
MLTVSLSEKEHFHSVRDSDSMSNCVKNESRKIVLAQFEANQYSIATLLQAVAGDSTQVSIRAITALRRAFLVSILFEFNMSCRTGYLKYTMGTQIQPVHIGRH